ncbi:hypothetical protein [Salinibacter altiplanensis]|uniref:hypothetical protein n=1 Tax=Salinibacter altiplanensis TaxID=1803181 RepID=UPI000C9F1236|nr:hypothetical protein [Salinibacter altiplanensis]
MSLGNNGALAYKSGKPAAAWIQDQGLDPSRLELDATMVDAPVIVVRNPGKSVNAAGQLL